MSSDVRRARRRTMTVALVGLLVVTGAPTARPLPARTPMTHPIRAGAAAVRALRTPTATARGLPVRTPRQEPEAFVVLVGTDTFAVERIRRTVDRLSGEITGRQIGRIRYTAALRGDGLVSSIRLESWPPFSPDSAPPSETATVAFRGDSAIAEVASGGGVPQEQRIVTREGALPLISVSFGLIEQLVLRARALGGDEVEIPLFNLAGGVTIPARVRRLSDDSAVVAVAGTETRARIGVDGTLLGGRIAAQNLTFERVPWTGVDVAARRPNYSAPAGAPYAAEEVRVETPAGHVLAGTLTLPRNGGPFPAVVTITGSGGQERDESVIAGYRPFRQIADTLSRRGIAVLRLDDRGVGASTGDFAGATSEDFADDVRAALAYLRGRDDIDERRLALVGHSEGGLIAPLVAASDPALRAIVTLAGPARPGLDIIRYQQRYVVGRDTTLTAAGRDSALAAMAVMLDSAAAASPWLHWFLDHDPRAVAARVAQPVLILHGATDRQVTAEQAEELAAAIRAGGNDDVTARVFPGLNHLFLEDSVGDPMRYSSLASRRIPAHVLGDIADWLVERLDAEPIDPND